MTKVSVLSNLRISGCELKDNYYRSFILMFKTIFYESRSFRSYSRSVRSFWLRSFRPDFWGEWFRPSWGGSFRHYFIGGSFRCYFWGESFQPDLFILGKRKTIKLNSSCFCFDKAGKTYVFDSVNVIKEVISFWKIPPSNNLVNCHTSYCKQCSLYILKVGT